MNLKEIEGIGADFEGKLKKAGVNSVEGLLEKGATPTLRKNISEASGIYEKMILTWVNHADLMRIDGIGGEYAELLEASGVDTVKELAQRNAENLAEKMREVNKSKKLTRQVPSAETLSKWISAAKTLPRAIQY